MALFQRTRTAPPAATTGTDPALAALTGTYTVDPAHSSLGFTVRHAMVTNVRGFFQEFDGTLSLDGTDPARSGAALTVNIGGIDTGNGDRDEHLRSADFFDAATYPAMTFRSTAAERTDEDSYRLTGDLTIKDVTRPVTIDLTFNGAATDAFGNERVGFEGTAQILRSDWGLTWNANLETGGVLVSDKVRLTFDISAIRESAPEAG